MATVSLITTVNTNDTATITDGTVFTSPTRSSVGVFLTVFKVSALSVQTSITATSNNSDPETDTTWTFPINNDGWYQAYYAAIADYGIGTNYNQYQASFDPATNNVYRSKVDSNVGQSLSNTDYWELISNPSSLAANKDTSTESTNIDSLVFNDIILNKVTNFRGDKAIDAAQEGASAVDEPIESTWFFSIADFNMEAALTAEIRQQFAAGERYTRRMDELVGI